MDYDLKRAIDTIKMECRKPKVAGNCTWEYTARCNLICEVCGYNSQSTVKRLLDRRMPEQYDIEKWEKE